MVFCVNVMVHFQFEKISKRINIVCATFKILISFITLSLNIHSCSVHPVFGKSNILPTLTAEENQ